MKENIVREWSKKAGADLDALYKLCAGNDHRLNALDCEQLSSLTDYQDFNAISHFHGTEKLLLGAISGLKSMENQ